MEDEIRRRRLTNGQTIIEAKGFPGYRVFLDKVGLSNDDLKNPDFSKLNEQQRLVLYTGLITGNMLRLGGIVTRQGEILDEQEIFMSEDARDSYRARIAQERYKATTASLADQHIGTILTTERDLTPNTKVHFVAPGILENLKMIGRLFYLPTALGRTCADDLLDSLAAHIDQQQHAALEKFSAKSLVRQVAFDLYSDKESLTHGIV